MTSCEPRSTAPPRRRWFQYSLRSFLLVTAIVAVWLGHIAGSARRQRKAFETLAARQCDVYFRHDLIYSEDGPLFGGFGGLYRHVTGREWYHVVGAQPHGPKWLRDWLGEDYFRTVAAVEVPPIEESNPEDTGPVMERLLEDVSGLGHLRSLSLDGCKDMTDADCEDLNAIKGLERLFLADTGITDAGLANLAELTHLRFLSLAGTKITDAGLVHLKRMRRLEMLELSNTSISDEGLKYLIPLKGLKYVYVDGTRVTKKGAQALEAVLPNCHVRFCGAGAVGFRSNPSTSALAVGRSAGPSGVWAVSFGPAAMASGEAGVAPN